MKKVLSIEEINQCPICKNDDLNIICSVDKFPYIGYSILKEEKDEIIKNYDLSSLFSPLKIMKCDKCKHVFQAIKPNDKLMNMIYNKYYNYPSSMISGFIYKREKIFLDYFLNVICPLCKKRRLNKILEIACFDGVILNELSKKQFEVYGCDPSKGADIANKFGIKVHKNCFNSNYYINKNESFDIIIFRHFIEHVYDPIELLEDVKKILNKNGLIIFETPNVEYYLENGSFETFNLQHLQNFSIYSIKKSLKKSSLKVINYKITPENLIVVSSESGDLLSIVKNDLWNKNTNEFYSNLQKNIGYIKSLVNSYTNKKIILWGAGGLCGYFPLIYDINIDIISYIVDMDKRKWNMNFINNNLKIYSPEKLLSDNVDLIIITSMYGQEIINQIKKMNIKSDIISLTPKVNFIKCDDENETNKIIGEDQKY